MRNQHVAKELARSQELNQYFESSSTAVEQVGKLLLAGRVGEESLQIIERHVRIGTARQESTQPATKLCRGSRVERGGEMGQVTAAPFGVANAPGLQQTSGFIRGFEA